MNQALPSHPQDAPQQEREKRQRRKKKSKTGVGEVLLVVGSSQRRISMDEESHVVH
jgi:hypothetical protein